MSSRAAGASRGATPVMVLAGALGAGKTTLLSRCLADPSFARTAVVIDEIAELEVDPHLLPASSTLVRRAPCGRWTEALHDLERERDAGAGFERVIVEANGVTSPACVVAALEEDKSLRERFPLEGIVAAVDAAGGADAVATDALARAQAAGADAVVLTKLDIADPGAVPSLVAALLRLNPYAAILRATPEFAAPSLWSAASQAPGREVRRLAGVVDAVTLPQAGALCVRFAHAVELSGFCVRLANFLEQHSRELLRVKGLVRVEGRHGPAVIQAVGSTLYPVRTLKEWPRGVEESALVVVARGMPDDELRVGVERAGAARKSRR